MLDAYSIAFSLNLVEFMPKKLCDNFSKPLSYV